MYDYLVLHSRTAFCGCKHGTGVYYYSILWLYVKNFPCHTVMEVKTKWNVKMYMVWIEQVKYVGKIKKITSKICALILQKYWPFFYTISLFPLFQMPCIELRICDFSVTNLFMPMFILTKSEWHIYYLFFSNKLLFEIPRKRPY